jgi:hypothetical protein
MLGGESEVGRQNERAGARPERERESAGDRTRAGETDRQTERERASEKQ